jgi:hypothetical protein
LEQAWSSILHSTSQQSKSHIQLSDTLTTHVLEKLKSLQTTFEESRKKHINFAAKLQSSRREKAFMSMEKARRKYEEGCMNVENAKGKFERAPDEKTAEKLKRAWHQEILELNNAKVDTQVSYHLRPDC